jgi:hypothetical protein
LICPDGYSGGTIYATNWIGVHVFASGDPASYSFTAPEEEDEVCFNDGGPIELLGEVSAFSVRYRAASQGLSNYSLYGYVNGDSLDPTTSVGTGSLSTSPDVLLLNLFEGTTSEGREDNGLNLNFTAPTGSPAIMTRTPLSSPGGVLAADVYTGASGGMFGGYSTTYTGGLAGTNAAFQIVIPPL